MTELIQRATEKSSKYVGGINENTKGEVHQEFVKRIAYHKTNDPFFDAVLYAYTDNVKKSEELIKEGWTKKDASNCESKPGYCYILQARMLVAKH